MRLTRRDFVLSGAAAAALGTGAIVRGVRAGTVTHPEWLIVVFVNGGWDTTMCLDPKPGNPNIDGGDYDHPDTEYFETFNENQLIACNDAVRPSVRTYFENWGAKTAVVNGMWTGSIVHEPCRIRLLTGTTIPTRPDFATIFGEITGTEAPIGMVDFSGVSYPGDLAAATARVGARSQLKALVDPDVAYGPPSWASYGLPMFTTTGDQRSAVRAVLEERAAQMRLFRSDGGGNDLRLDGLVQSLDRASRLYADGPTLTAGLQLSKVPSFASQRELAADLLEAGLCRSVTLTHSGDWDTHSGNATQHTLYESLFSHLDLLLSDLDARGMLDRTLVAVLSEMGRTPKRNAGNGKDHWAHTSQLLIGAGVNGGRVFGGTDDVLESMKIDYATGETFGAGWDETVAGDRLRYDSFAAGILHHMGIDTAPWFPNVQPFTAFSSVV